MSVPELPGALCRQHPDPDLWTSDMHSEQEEARRVFRICPELADCRAWTLAQPAYRVDAGMVAAMTPAERFAERRKRRQKPRLAKLEPVRPGRAAPSLTRYPGPKPPPFARRGADGHGRRRVRGIPQPERLSTRHLRGVAPRPTLGLTQRPGQRQSRPLCVTTSRAGPRPEQGHNLTKRGGVPASPQPTCPGWCRHGRPARSDRVALPRRLDPLVPVGRVALRDRPGAAPAPVGRALVPRLAG